MSKGWVLFVLAFVGCLGVTACGGGGTSDPGDSETNASDGDTEKADGDVDTDKADGDEAVTVTPGGSCPAGTNACLRYKLYTCTNGIWAEAADCYENNKQGCVNGACTTITYQGSCSYTGAPLCYNEAVITCQDGKWESTQNCPDQGLACWNGACIDSSAIDGYVVPPDGAQRCVCKDSVCKRSIFHDYMNWSDGGTTCGDLHSCHLGECD